MCSKTSSSTYEFRIILWGDKNHVDFERQLNKWGKLGFRFVCRDGSYYVLERDCSPR